MFFRNKFKVGDIVQYYKSGSLYTGEIIKIYNNIFSKEYLIINDKDKDYSSVIKIMKDRLIKKIDKK